MKIVMDYDLCQGHAVCMGEAPEVFHVDAKGIHTVLQESPPEELREKVEAAVEYCPTGAIRIVD
jgi:ferredoxin